ncbi:beta-ketoacyl synthase N-terminal-like domain-containing protein [uncultured Erythrobacter sp.]|uniref:beta-ketoacyl synthase N-terminal-like domain-containing protein n=1 Tax=uncultured Erythrobacter sp. TaxID=263913 RepID=UPI002611DAE6|nr:beta-ketoacyl synthase N-terminal-like domain-containing protein [uncultured Erythrobacter sp.]
MSADREKRAVVVTGMGIVCPLGCSSEAIIHALNQTDASSGIDRQTFAPYPVRPAVNTNGDRFLRRPGERRVMSDMMLHAVEAAGQALSSAGLIGREEGLDDINMLVAAGMSARDPRADAELLAERGNTAQTGPAFNRRLQSELKPTLFLAQLSNLVAGNLSLMFGIKGSSRTISGEEIAGAQCLETAFRQIASGQREVVLVGGSFSAERPEVIASYAAAGILAHNEVPDAGAVLATASVFLVLESATSAEMRGQKPLARMRDVQTRLGNRKAKGDISSNAAKLLDTWSRADSGDKIAIVDGSPSRSVLSEESDALIEIARTSKAMSLAGRFGRADRFGHPIDASALLSAWIGLSMLNEPDFPAEDKVDCSPDAVLCCDWGLRFGESEVLLEKA